MKIEKDRIERRTMKVSAPEGTEEVRAEGIEPTADKMIVEGYAVLFDQPQTYTWGKQTYTEIISRNALASADMTQSLRWHG